VPEPTELETLRAPRQRVTAGRLERPKLDLRWILRQLGDEQVTNLLVEGGGEVNASFLEQRLVHRIAFYYAPRILGEAAGRKAVAGVGSLEWRTIAHLCRVEWRRLGADLFLTARLDR
jgi:diaminohydroxyphosphoribosylaminopyrimidine deaminase/5-amino-6-(5-phosphoribosylamino)uracil reductase